MITRANYFDYVRANGLPDDKDVKEGDELLRALTNNGQSWERIDGDKTLTELADKYLQLLNQLTAAKPAKKSHRTKPGVARQQQQSLAFARARKGHTGAKAGRAQLRGADAQKVAETGVGRLVRRGARAAAAAVSAKPAEQPKAAAAPKPRAARPATPPPRATAPAKTTVPKADKTALADAKKTQQGRGAAGKRDAKSTNKDRMVATEKNVRTWKKNPGDSDLIGVDSADKTNPTVGVSKRGSSPSKAGKATPAQTSATRTPAASPGRAKATRKGSASATLTATPQRQSLLGRLLGRNTTPKAAEKKPIAVKGKADLSGKNFIQEVDRLAKQIHENSATGRYRQVPEYRISRSSAKDQAFDALSRVRSGKVRNVKLKA